MSKLYFYKCAHFLLFLSHSTFFIHHFHSHAKILTLIPLIPTPNSPHSHPDSMHSHPYSSHFQPDSPHCHHSHLDSPNSHPYSSHSNPDSPHSHPDSPHSHHSDPDSLHSHHSPHPVPRFAIPAFRASYMAPKILSKAAETIKMSSSLEIRMCLPPLRKIFATCWFR